MLNEKIFILFYIYLQQTTGGKKRGVKKSVGASGNCPAISTVPQINLDVLHPSADYMES